jgi:hypothetical protein
VRIGTIYCLKKSCGVIGCGQPRLKNFEITDVCDPTFERENSEGLTDGIAQARLDLADGKTSNEDQIRAEFGVLRQSAR